jgi:phosphoribosylanthranilate isomerase
MWIKICANTNLADAQLATSLGADALGFVFAPSARQVTVEQVGAITPHLPNAVETFAVVQSRDLDEIVEIVRKTGLTGVQLHGGLDLALARRLHAALEGRVRLIQTLHWQVEDDAASATALADALHALEDEPAITHVLIDAKVGKASGGTGRGFNWNAARTVLQSACVTHKMNVILAGGLHAENVPEAIRTLAPWGVDVASGVEAAPGRKDPGKLERFIAAARANG